MFHRQEILLYIFIFCTYHRDFSYRKKNCTLLQQCDTLPNLTYIHFSTKVKIWTSFLLYFFYHTLLQEGWTKFGYTCVSLDNAKIWLLPLFLQQQTTLNWRNWRSFVFYFNDCIDFKMSLYSHRFQNIQKKMLVPISGMIS